MTNPYLKRLKSCDASGGKRPDSQKHGFLDGICHLSWVILGKTMTEVFRALRIENVDAVVEIEKTVYEDPWTRQLLEESLSAPMTYTLGLFKEDLLGGYAIYQVIFSEAHLLNLAIRSELQKRGYGQKLLSKVLEDIQKRGALHFFLEVRPSNILAQKLYERNGFRILMRRPKYYSNGEDALVMIKDL